MTAGGVEHTRRWAGRSGLIGKGALLLPPEEPVTKRELTKPKRKRLSKKKPLYHGPLAHTRQALAVIQKMQNRHRLETSRAL